MILENIKLKSDLHKYCILCTWIKKGFQLDMPTQALYLELDDKYQHHRLSNHPSYTQIMSSIGKEFPHAHLRVVLREFDVPEKIEMEMEAFDELLKNCSLIVK